MDLDNLPKLQHNPSSPNIPSTYPGLRRLQTPGLQSQIQYIGMYLHKEWMLLSIYAGKALFVVRYYPSPVHPFVVLPKSKDPKELKSEHTTPCGLDLLQIVNEIEKWYCLSNCRKQWQPQEIKRYLDWYCLSSWRKQWQLQEIKGYLELYYPSLFCLVHNKPKNIVPTAGDWVNVLPWKQYSKWLFPHFPPKYLWSSISGSCFRESEKEHR